MKKQKQKTKDPSEMCTLELLEASPPPQDTPYLHCCRGREGFESWYQVGEIKFPDHASAELYCRMAASFQPMRYALAKVSALVAMFDTEEIAKMHHTPSKSTTMVAIVNAMKLSEGQKITK